jgi:pseudouridylate synthase / pseudouridine kinase
MADMSIFTHRSYQVEPTPQHQRGIKWSVIDANWDSSRIHGLLKGASSAGLKVAFEPVSTHKSANLFKTSERRAPQLGAFPYHLIHLATPNQHELAAMHASAKKHEYFETDRWWQIIDALGIPSSGARDRFVKLTNHKMTDKGIPLQTIQLLPYIPTILTKLGPEGVLLTELLAPNDSRLTDPASAPYILSRCTNGSTEVGGVYMRLFPAVEVVDDVVSVNGVGDTFLGVLVAGLAKGLSLDENLIDTAQRGAVMTLRCKEAVSPDLGKLAKELDSLAQGAIMLSAAGL